tara:strand:+ start:602 stop:1441 length:840 start_codon:yes stop_codon:yes gene_type:complete
MSGASAVASARRRRADPTPRSITPPSGQPGPSQPTRSVEDSTPKHTSTPLQILQVHDKKIKELEESLEGTIVEISKKVLSENLKHFNLDKPPAQVKEFDSKPLLEKITTLSSKFDELKLLVIKSQQTSNDSNLEMLKFKDKVLGLEEHVLQLELQLKEAEGNDENIFNMDGDGAAEMLLRSMMQSTVMANTEDGKLNIHEPESDDECNDLGEVSEIALTESELDSIKSEVQAVLVEETIKPDQLVPDDKIEVSEDDEPLVVKKKDEEGEQVIEEVEREE